jgi:Domain of unknown function (DUF4440)
MIRLIVSIVAGLLAGFGMDQALADSSDLQTAIDARYSEMKTAMTSHDSKALRAILAPDFVSIDTSDKSETADSMIAAVNSMQADPNKVSKTTLISVKRIGAGAKVEQRYEMNTQRIGNDGRDHAVRLETISTDTWVLAQGQWRIQRTITNKLDYYIDGKVAAHKERANAGVNP